MYKVYMVKPNDTLDLIAMNHNVSVSELKKINGDILSLYPGMQLIVPNIVDYQVYEVITGDNLYTIANKYGVSLDNLITLNGLNKNDYIYPGQQLLIPDIETDIYTTNDDTLNGILKKLNINLDELLSFNNEVYLEDGQPIRYKGRK